MAAEDIPTFGEIDDDELALIETDTFEIPVVAYKVQGKKRVPVTHTFRFAGMRAFGAVADFIEAGTAAGGISLVLALPFVTDSLADDDERGRFKAFLDDPGLITHATTVANVADWLSSRYLNRPTLPESGSSPGRSAMNGASGRPGSGRAGANSARPRRT